MFNITQDLKETLRQHFIFQKLEISYAICKPFPFLEGLRDKSFISEKMYMESMEACRNMVPVSKVVYNILTKMEEPFNLSFLEMLFSQINLREYPNLVAIQRSFRNVFASCGGWRGATVTVFEVPTNSRGRSPHQNLPPLPAPQRPPLRCPTPVPRFNQPSAIPQHSNKILDKPPHSAGPAKTLPRVIQEGRTTPANLTSHINDEEDSQQVPSTPPATVQVSSDHPTPQVKDKEDTQEMPQAPSAPEPVIRNDSPEPNEPVEPQEAASTPLIKKGKKRKRSMWSVPKKRQQKKRLSKGTASPGHRIQEKLQMVDQVTQGKDDSTRNSKVVIRTQKARTECAQTSGPEGTTSPVPQMVDQATQKKNNSTGNSRVMTRSQKARTECAQTSGPEEKKRKKDVCSSSTISGQKNIPQKEKPKDDTVDFQSPTLPVTCGGEMGILHKEKMEKGSSEKCIQNEEGVWFTPREFEIKGRGTKSKDWKRNVRCKGQTLQQLMEKGLLYCPSRISLKREWENSNECEVCCGEGQLLCCDACPRAFHEDCHIPPMEAKRSPWSCTFCRMKESSGSQQYLRGSEVLTRQMGPEEQLIRDYAEPFKEAMWLDLVKERLTEKVYTVEWFVRDIRLIFHNHKTFYKASALGQIGLDLEAKFEKDLKEVLIFHGASENSLQAPP
ncbi:sp110 nuclear body protein isoform X2 [Myotis myotis]|uniref:sp110 nuclear body protein isoform X2 n=1 Tax=Myotis myotis TaxID=51298 RepID=UPI00174A1B1D|nr:sp110 nuclear body protein isoform X2 [Myotis myotis]